MKFLKWIRTQWRKVSYTGGGMLMMENIYGKFYVTYPDGKRSCNMSWGTANGYKEIFGGNVSEIN